MDLAPEFNTGKLFDIPTGKFCGDEILNGGAVLPSQFSTGYPLNSGHLFHVFNLINESLRKTAPETTERYRLATMLFKMIGLGVTWEDESIAPIVSWFDLEGNIDFMGDLVRDILTKDYAKELEEQEKIKKGSVAYATQVMSAYKEAHEKGDGMFIDSISHL